jgi:hypothetical protein
VVSEAEKVARRRPKHCGWAHACGAGEAKRIRSRGFPDLWFDGNEGKRRDVAHSTGGFAEVGVHGAEEIEGGAGAGAGKDRDGAVAEGGGTEEACGVEGVGEERGGWGGRSYLGERRLGLREK